MLVVGLIDDDDDCILSRPDGGADVDFERFNCVREVTSERQGHVFDGPWQSAGESSTDHDDLGRREASR